MSVDDPEDPEVLPEEIVHWQPTHHADATVRPNLAAIGVVAAFAAVGALAIGALAIGTLAIGSLVIGRARFRRLEIDDLVVKRLHVRDRR